MIMKTRLQLIARSAQRGFTLVETVIAIGIVSTVMVALLGLMPEGMSMVSQAGQKTVGVRISSQIISEIQQQPFDALADFNNKKFYFDDQGTQLDEAGDPFRVYTAKVEVDPSPQELPGCDPTSLLRRVVVKVSDRPGDIDFSERASGEDYLPYPTYITNFEDEYQGR